MKYKDENSRAIGFRQPVVGRLKKLRILTAGPRSTESEEKFHHNIRKAKPRKWKYFWVVLHIQLLRDKH
jgi:hypothetical protein